MCVVTHRLFVAEPKTGAPEFKHPRQAAPRITAEADAMQTDGENARPASASPRPPVTIFLTAPVARNWRNFPEHAKDRSRGLELDAWRNANVALTPAEERELLALKAKRAYHRERHALDVAKRTYSRVACEASAPLMAPVYAKDLATAGCLKQEYEALCERAERAWKAVDPL